MKRKISINDAEYPLRKKAIEIMEFIAEYMGDEKMFDCKNGNSRWYDLEDEILTILKRRR